MVNHQKPTLTEEKKVRIGILTAARTNNIGTDLQALAMQWLLSKNGVCAELINYRCPKLENSRKFFYPHSIKGLMNILYKIKVHGFHQAFRKKHFNYSDIEYDSTSIAQNPYDVIVVGSDQIWNLSIVGNDFSFFLPYRNSNQKKYAYAPSFGKSDIKSWNEQYHLDEMLNDFDGVTVREVSGVKALADIGITAQQALDPILMHPGEKWAQLVESIHPAKRYVFVYCVEREAEAIQFAKAHAMQQGMDVVVYGRHLKPIKGVKIVQTSSIEQWLGYMNQADLIVTNSYHGLSFAVNFHKSFSILWLKNLQSNNRMENLLDITGIGVCGDKEIVKPDWAEVEQCLIMCRQNSQRYIEKVVKSHE